MYPDYLALTGEGYVPSMYKKYGKVISPMGCVDGNEVVTYKFNGKLYVECFERMWNRFSLLKQDVGQRNKNDVNRIINLNDENVEIYDTKTGFTKLKYIIRNKQNNWCDITFTNGRTLTVTTDHPFETSNGVVFAKDLTEEDVIEIGTKQYSEETIDINALDAYINSECITYNDFPNDVFSYKQSAKFCFLAGIVDKIGKINEGKSIIELQYNCKEIAIETMYLIQSLGMIAELYKNDDNIFTVIFNANSELIDSMLSDKKEKIVPMNETKETEMTCTLKEIKFFTKEKYSYDVTTESEHFEVSGVYSHNCRAFLSPWYEKGGMHPVDENDEPIFIGRYNLGVVTLNLPMIFMKAKTKQKDFYEVLNYYLEMIREFHKRTIEYIGNFRAGSNPVAFCEGGFYGGNLKPDDKIAPILKSSTISFGYTALNELQELYNGKSIREDGKFALEVMEYINKKIDEYKEEDDILYAIYGTPAETLISKQVKQFKAKYGIIPKVSDREYFTNSFHDGVWEDITQIEKQDDEKRFWSLSNGGKIQYCRYPVKYNKEAIKTLVRRAMKMGFYEGVNLMLSYCNSCGHQELDMDFCPICGSKNITAINRMNG